jgi:hypothetical protein
MGKPAILITSTESNGEIPAALSGFYCIEYDHSDLSKLIFYLERTMQPYVSEAAAKCHFVLWRCHFAQSLTFPLHIQRYLSDKRSIRVERGDQKV